MPTTVTRTVVAVHGISSGGNSDVAGYTKATRHAMENFLAGLGDFRVPFVEALWADLAEKHFSKDYADAAQALVTSAIGGGVLGGVVGVLSWLEVPSLADVIDMVADVFIYDAGRVDEIKQSVRDQIETARTGAGGRGIVLHGNSLGSVVALDIVSDLVEEGAISDAKSPDEWPVRALLTTGSPLALQLPIITGYDNRAERLATLLSTQLPGFVWKNLYDQNDPVVSGSLLGSALGTSNLVSLPGYTRLNVQEATPQTGFHLQAHTGYWRHPIVAQTLFTLANL